MPLLHVLGNAGLIALFGAIGALAARRKKARLPCILAAVTLGLASRWASGHPSVYFRLFPFAGAIFYSNQYPFAAALLIAPAVGVSKSRGQKIRVGFLAMILLAVSLLPFRDFFLPPAASRGTEIDANGVCLQSSLDTCSAAAIVTLMRLHGVETTEAEAVQLALTKHRRGTQTLGLYRGLKILGKRKAGLHARVRRPNADALLAANLPAIITVGLPARIATPAQREMVERFHWDAGVRHSVVFLGADPADKAWVFIGEPAFGRERWPVEHLRLLYLDEAFYVNNPGREGG